MCTTNNTDQSLATVGNVLGTYEQMRSAKNNAAYQASVANQNAAIANAQAVSVGQAGANEQINIRKRGRQFAGTQKAALSANGLDVGAGSPLAILSNTAYLTEQDAQTSRQNTQMQMWELNNQANNYRSQASYATAAGKNQSNSALLTGLTAAAKQYSTFGNTTVDKTKANANITVPLVPTDSSGNYFIGNNNYAINKPDMPGVKKYKSYF